MRNGGICSMNEKGGAGVKIPRFMLAAPNSGSGKTLITCGLLQALKNRGLQPASFKCGPDYIDPLFHTKVLGVPSRNLDTYFTGRDLTCALFGTHAQNADLAVMEGVMGFYDGGCRCDLRGLFLGTGRCDRYTGDSCDQYAGDESVCSGSDPGISADEAGISYPGRHSESDIGIYVPAAAPVIENLCQIQCLDMCRR